MTDVLVEAVRSAMTSYLLENVSPDTVRVALQAIEAAGYRVVPVEASRGYRQEVWSLLEANAAAGNISAGHIAGNGMPDAFYAAMLSAAPRVGEG